MPLDRPLPDRTALILVDLQLAVDNPRWARHGPRNNPAAEAAAATLLTCWRRLGWPIVHIRHDSTEPESTYKPGGPGHEFKPEVAPSTDETIIAKQVNSAFIGTDLHRHLRDIDAPALVVLGVITNNSLEATVRNAGNLGHVVFVPEDACFTYGWKDLRGKIWTAEDVHALSLANLHGEYATVTNSAEILANVPA
jgi:nicotinamidase-related amidase